MSDMLDTLTRGPFRDDTHRAAVEAAAEDLSGEQLSGHSGQLAKAPAEPVDGDFGADARDTRVEAEDGRVRAFQRPVPFIAGSYHAARAKHALTMAELHIAAIYDAATRACASAGPLPLRAFPRDVLDWLDGPGDDGGSPAWHRAVLDASAALYPDLVPNTTMPGEQHD